MKAKKACKRVKLQKECFYISANMFTKWRKLKEELKMVNDGAAIACLLLSAVKHLN